MKQYLNGIHLANGEQNLSLILSNDFKAFTYLDGQQPEVEAIKISVTDALLVCRIYNENFLTKTPYQLAWEIFRINADHVIPWNEANLGYEVGQPGLEQQLGWKETHFKRLESYWKELVHYIRTFSPNKTIHFPAWSPWDGTTGPFWDGADVYDLHLYGTTEHMHNLLLGSLTKIPQGKPVYISEWNFGKSWSQVTQEEINSFLSILNHYPQVLGATAYIWQWYNPDLNHPNFDIVDTSVAEYLVNWTDRWDYLIGNVRRDSNMEQVDVDELKRVASIFNNWYSLRRGLADFVSGTVGQYGITDSLDIREANELKSAVDGLNIIINKYS